MSSLGVRLVSDSKNLSAVLDTVCQTRSFMSSLGIRRVSDSKNLSAVLDTVCQTRSFMISLAVRHSKLLLSFGF